jgi:hypothetical protein
MLTSLLTVLLCTVADTSISGQPNVLARVNTAIDEIITDMLGNIYVVSDATITQYDENGRKLFHYTDNIAGSPATTDVSDPMRIMLFYPDQNMLTFLDRTLSKLEQSVMLDRISPLSPITACNSSRGSFWLLDRQDLRLKCYDRSLNILVQSQSLADLINLSDNCHLQESENHLILQVKRKGIYLFDRFGNLLTFFPQKEVLFARLNAGKIEVSANTGFYETEIANGKQTPGWKPFPGMYILHLLRNKFICWNKNGFVIIEQKP